MGLFDEIKKHGSETYDTLSEGLMGDRARGLLDMFAGNIKSGLPMLDKDPMDWEAADVLNVAMGGTIAGRMAKTANPDMLKRADEMKAAGYSRDEIWKTTGEEFNQPAFFDGDGNLKWEIDDSAYKYTPENLDKESFSGMSYRKGTVAKSTDHPAMLDAYPDLKDVQSIDYPFRSKARLSGQYTPEDAKWKTPASVTLWDGGSSTKRSTNLHELNHGIQDIENLPLGGSQKQFTTVDNAADIDMLSDANILNKITSKMKGDIDQAKVTFKSMLGRDPALGAESIVLGGESSESIIKRREALKLASKTPYEIYQRLAGEADARAVEARMDMTMPERIARPFPKDYDVPESEFIYNYRKGLLE